MGRKWGKKGGRKRKDNPDKDTWLNIPNKRTPGAAAVPRSPVFEAYYKAQGIVAPEEWDTFMSILADPLPASFRINMDCDYADLLLEEIERHAGETRVVDGVEVQTLKKLEWYYGGRAYQLAVDRRTLRRSSELEAFHETIKMHTDAGSITRQEAVSMIPPLALNIEPHHKVLDMCAAPGSKTSQMLETISVGSLKSGQEPKGYVVANDADTSRAYMLVHQCKRPMLCSASYDQTHTPPPHRINTVALAVTTHKGQAFPGPENLDSIGEAQFDRVLCDVPCSGDGTVRKTLNIWNQWHPSAGIHLHPLQLMIARKGAVLLKTGGMMVYSTCSMNPVEDEAVVTALIEGSYGALELVDPRPLLPGLVVRPGLKTWVVMDGVAGGAASSSAGGGIGRGGGTSTVGGGGKGRTGDGDLGGDGRDTGGNIATGANAEGGRAAPHTGAVAEVDGGDNVKPMSISEGSSTSGVDLAAATSNGHPTPTSTSPPHSAHAPSSPMHGVVGGGSIDHDEIRAAGLSLMHTYSDVPERDTRRIRPTCFPPPKEVADRTRLEYCMRCVPHDQNTGGFFIALIRKVKPMPAGSTEGEDVDVTDTVTAAEANPHPSAAPSSASPPSPDKLKKELSASSDVRGRGGGGKMGRQTGAGGSSRHFVPHAWFFPLPQDTWKHIKDFHGIDDDFPADRLFLRKDAMNVVSYLSEGIVNDLEISEKSKLQLVHLGLKMFDRGNKDRSPCEYRMTQDGVSYLLPYIRRSGKRVVDVNQEEFALIVQQGFVKFDDLRTEVVDKIQAMEMGGFVFCLVVGEKEKAGTTGDATVATGDGHAVHKGYNVVAWKGLGPKINIMCAKHDLFVFRCRLAAAGMLEGGRSLLPAHPVKGVEDKKQGGTAEEMGGKGKEQEGEDESIDRGDGDDAGGGNETEEASVIV